MLFSITRKHGVRSQFTEFVAYFSYSRPSLRPHLSRIEGTIILVNRGYRGILSELRPWLRHIRRVGRVHLRLYLKHRNPLRHSSGSGERSTCSTEYFSKPEKNTLLRRGRNFYRSLHGKRKLANRKR